MNRWIMIALLSLLCKSAYALPVRNPSEPDLIYCGVFYNEADSCLPFHLCVGFESDYVFERHLQDKATPHRKVDHAHLYTNAGYVALNVCERVAIFSTLGASLLQIESTAFPFLPAPGFGDGNWVEIDTHTTFSWSVGLRGILYEWCGLRLGFEGEYFRTSPTVNMISVNSNFSNYPSDLHMIYQEWQVGLGLAYSIVDTVFPYIAVKWSGCHVDLDDFHSTFPGLTPTKFITLNDLQNSRHVGYAVGFSFSLEALLFTIEWSFQDERALFLSGQVRY